MTEDLANTLRELGPGYHEVVDRLFAARETPGRFRWLLFANRRTCWLVAASLVAVAGVFAVFAPAMSRGPKPTVAFGGEYRLALAADAAAIGEIIRTQNADGSWKNDFLTKRNAAALKSCATADARIAYKKAMRNLRIRGAL